jgi:hypothetical protein
MRRLAGDCIWLSLVDHAQAFTDTRADLPTNPSPPESNRALHARSSTSRVAVEVVDGEWKAGGLRASEPLISDVRGLEQTMDLLKGLNRLSGAPPRRALLWLEDNVKVNQSPGHQEPSSFLAGGPGDGTEGCGSTEVKHSLPINPTL